MKNEKQWLAEERTFASISNAFVEDKHIQVHGIKPDSNELGYTYPDNVKKNLAHIYVCRYNKYYMSDLDEEKQSLFRLGIFVHETLHQVYTDFDETVRYINKYKSSSESVAKLFQTIANIVEDSRIEANADSVFGGTTLSSLQFSIGEIYKKSHKIDEKIEDEFGEKKDPSALTQILNALIQVGDVGFFKGKFLTEKAKDIFYRILPTFEAGASKAKGKDSLKESAKITDILAKEFADLLSEQKFNMSNFYNGKGSGKAFDGEPSSEASERRRILISKHSSSEPSDDSSSCSGSKSKTGSEVDSSSDSKSISESSSGSGSSPDKKPDIPPSKSSKGDSDDRSSDSKKLSDDLFEEVEDCEEDDLDDFFDLTGDSEEDSEGDSEGNSEKDSEDVSDEEADSDSDSSEKTSHEEISPMESSESTDDSSIPSSPEVEWRDDDVGISEDELKEALKSLKVSISDEEKKLEKDTCDEKKLSDIDNISVKDNYVTKIVNNRVKVQQKEAYNAIVSENQSVIKSLSRNIKSILDKRKEEAERKTSGKINIKRYSSPNYTGSRVFDKKSNSEIDTCLFLLVDESGSMGGEKARCARDSAVILAEMAYNLRIPVYVMGFSGDETASRSGEHYHYVCWNNTKGDRYTIPNIKARYQNRDGLAVRTATDIIKKRNESEKILLVLSDGEPWAGGYGGPEAIADTKLAVREAKKVCKVLGLAIGTSSTNQIHSIYQNDFMLCSKPQELKYKLLPALKRLLNK